MIRRLGALALLVVAPLGPAAAAPGEAPKAAPTPTASSTAPTLGPRLEAGFVTGQRVPTGLSPAKLRVNGVRAALDHRLGRWHLTAGYVGASEAARQDTVPSADDPAGAPPEPTPAPTGLDGWDHQAGVLVGVEWPWVQVGAGVGVARWLDRADGTARAQTDVRPAGRLRIGPREWVFVDAAYLDPSALAPGPGHARIGLGTAYANSHIWIGGAWRPQQRWSPAVAGRVPLDGGLHLMVSAVVDAVSPADWLLLQGGVGYTFGSPPRPPPKARPAGPAGPNTAPPLRPAWPAPGPAPADRPPGDPL